MNNFQRLAAILICSVTAFVFPVGAAPLKTLTIKATRTVSIDTSREEPYSLAYQANGDFLWAVNNGSNSVTVRDASDLRIVRRITVGAKPQFLALDEKRRRAFVVNSGENTLTRIDTISQSTVEKIEVDQAPQMAVVDGTSGAVWVTNRDSNTVSVYQPDSGTVRRFRTGKAPIGIALDASRHRVFVATSGAKSLSVFDTKELVRLEDIELPDFPMTVAINPTSGVLCTTLAKSNAVALTLLGDDERTIRIEVGEYPINVTCDPVSGLFFVANSASRTISVLDSNGQNLDEYETDKEPIGITVRAQNQRVFVAGFANNTLHCFDLPDYNADLTARAERFVSKPLLVSAPRSTDSTNANSSLIIPDAPHLSRAAIAALPAAPTEVLRNAPGRVATSRIPASQVPPQRGSVAVVLQTPGLKQGPIPLKRMTMVQSNMRLPVFPSADAQPALSPAPRRQFSAVSNSFGGVRDYVARSGMAVKQLFGVGTVYGIAKRASGTSDHPKGLALDFCVGSDSAKGDQIADYLLNNAAQHRVLYVIWKQHIRYPGEAVGRLQADRGNATANHYDHVHVSYLPSDN